MTIQIRLDAVSGRSSIDTERPMLVVVGWTAASPDGLELCRRLRADASLNPLRDLDCQRSGPRARPIWRRCIAAKLDDCLALPLAAHWSDVRTAAIKRQIREARQLLDMERALSESNERFDLAVRGSNEGLWDAHPLPGVHWLSPGTPVWYSERMKALLGFANDEFPNVLSSWTVRLHPDDATRVLEALTNHIDRRQPYDIEYRLLTRQGWAIVGTGARKGQAI